MARTLKCPLPINGLFSRSFAALCISLMLSCLHQPSAAAQSADATQPRSESEPASDSKSNDNDSDAESSNDSENATTKDERKRIVPRRSSAAARAKGEINFDDLVFDLPKDKPFQDKLLTKDIRELHGRKVKLRGFILPSTLFRESNIKQFVLVRDNKECCFGPGAALFDCVMVELVGTTTDYVTYPVTVEGKFEIDTKTYKYPGGKGPKGASHFAVFRIKGVNVK